MTSPVIGGIDRPKLTGCVETAFVCVVGKIFVAAAHWGTIGVLTIPSGVKAELCARLSHVCEFSGNEFITNQSCYIALGALFFGVPFSKFSGNGRCKKCDSGLFHFKDMFYND
jgi:hypothetical protein